MEGNGTHPTNANITSADDNEIVYFYLPQYLEQCYAFPFGIIGWVLHSVSVYVVICIWMGAKPLQPWKGIAYGGRSMFLSALTLGFSLGSTIATGLRCRHHWSLVFIAVGKGSSSTLNAVAGIYVSFTCRKKKNRERQGHRVRSDEYLLSAWYLVLYTPGMIVGALGGGKLTAEYFNFGDAGRVGLTQCMPVLLILLTWIIQTPFWIHLGKGVFGSRPVDNRFMGFLSSILVASSFQSYYNDWIIAIITRDTVSFTTAVEFSWHKMALFWGYAVGSQLLVLCV